MEAVAPVIKTDDATISATISSTQIPDLPMNGRNALMLATTTPGVLPGTKGTQGVPPGQDFIGAGTREIQNSMSLDGISIMNNLITTSPTQPMVETVQEVEVQTGTYSAQYGAYLGVHLNMITKGGTNTFTATWWNSFAMTRSTHAAISCPRPPERRRCGKTSTASRWMGPCSFPNCTTARTRPSSWDRGSGCATSGRASRRTTQ